MATVCHAVYLSEPNLRYLKSLVEEVHRRALKALDCRKGPLSILARDELLAESDRLREISYDLEGTIERIESTDGVQLAIKPIVDIVTNQPDAWANPVTD